MVNYTIGEGLQIFIAVTCLLLRTEQAHAPERYRDMSRARKKVKVDFRAYSTSSQSLLDSVEKVQDDANVFRVTVTDVWGNGSNLFKIV